MSYQKLILVGNLGRDPEMRYTSDGTPVTTLSLATNRRWNNSDGSKGEETIWFRVTLWRRDAENAAQYLQKGRRVLVEGRLNPDKATGGPRIWTGQDGAARASYEVTANHITYLGSQGNANAGGFNKQGAAEPAATYPEDDIPF